MTNTTSQPVSSQLASGIPVSRVWRGAVIAAATAAAAEIYVAAVRALGVPMKAGFFGAATAAPLTAASFATGVLVCTFWGAAPIVGAAGTGAVHRRRSPGRCWCGSCRSSPRR